MKTEQIQFGSYCLPYVSSFSVSISPTAPYRTHRMRFESGLAKVESFTATRPVKAAHRPWHSPICPRPPEGVPTGTSLLLFDTRQNCGRC